MQEVEEQPKAITTNNETSDSGFQIRAYLMACAHNWYWFVMSIIACACIAFLYSKSQPKLYSSSSLILVKTDKNTSAGSQSQVFSDLGINPTLSDVPNEIYKIKSTNLMEDVVNNLGLNVQYYGRVFLRNVNIYKSSPVQITPLRKVDANFTMTVVPKSDTELEFKIDDEGWQKAHFGNKVNTKFGPIAITKNSNFRLSDYKDFNIVVKVKTTQALAKQLVASLTAEQADKYSDVLKITLNWDNHEEAIDILKALIATYNQDAINDKNKVARNTESFIAERIDVLSKDLNGVDSRVAQLKVNSVNSAIYASPETSLKYADNAADIDMQISLAAYIEDYLNKMSGNNLIPSNTGIASTGIEAQINEYNQAMLKYQRIASTSSNENPVMIELNKSIASLKSNIMQSLGNYIRSLRMKQSHLTSYATPP